MVNRKRGLIRLGIVVAIGWFGFWSLVAWIGHNDMKSAQEALEFLEIQYSTWDAGPRPEEYWTTQAAIMEGMNNGNAKVKAAVQWGIGVPVVLIILTPIGWWIYRGFRPRNPAT